MKVGGKFGHYELFFNDSERNERTLAAFKNYKKQEDIKKLNNSSISIDEYKKLKSLGAGDTALFLAMTDSEVCKKLLKSPAKYRIKHKDLCDWTYDYMHQNPEILEEFYKNKRIYDAKAEVGIKSICLDDNLTDTVFACRKDTVLMYFNWDKIKGNGIIKKITYNGYADIAGLLNNSLFVDNPQTPDWRFGVSYDSCVPNKLKIVLLEKSGENSSENPQFKRLQSDTVMNLNDNEKHIYQNIKKVLSFAGISGGITLSSSMKKTGFMLGTSDDTGISFVITKPDRVYDNLSKAVWTFFPRANYVELPTSAEIRSRNICRAVDVIAFAHQKIFNSGNEK